MRLYLFRRFLFIPVSIFICFQVSAQKIILVDNSGLFYSLDTSAGTCSVQSISTPACGMSLQSGGYFSIALYKDTVYSNTADGFLYRSILGNSASCEELTTQVTTVAMTVDKDGLLFWVDDNDSLIKYDPHVNQRYNLGLVNYYPAGDLVFYQENLIMASSSGELINVNLENPGESKVFMETPGYLFYGLANLSTNCNQTVIFGLTASNGDQGSDLVEIDMASKRIIGNPCVLPIGILDAASISEIGGYGISSLLFPTHDSIFCKGSSFVLDAGNPGASYLWNDNSIGETKLVDSPGKYWVTVTASGCTGSDSIICDFIEPPVIQLPNDTSICTSEKLILNAYSPQATYIWQDGSTQPIYPVTRTGLYSVTVKNVCGLSMDSIKVQVENCNCKFFVPNAFSPNHDGINDLFLPKYKCILNDYFSSYELRVFNRWGQLMFATTNYSTGWDGSFQNKAQPEGTYVWELGYSDISTGKYTRKNGTVILIR